MLLTRSTPKLIRVGWALLPVGVLDGQECPSYYSEPWRI